MALSATFTANFASFYDAVEKADVKLKDFGAGADKVGGRLTALGNAFSGQKIVQDATLMVKAVEEIGGVTKLTDKEIARLGATTNEAVAKMKALGMDVPKNLQAIADQTKGATKATTAWAGSLTTVAGSFTKIASAVGVGFGISQVINFGKAIVDDAGHIADLSTKLGISAEAVQRFGYAADQTGASMDTVGSAIGKMNVTLAEGDKSTVTALDQIGLSFKDIRAMKPEDAFTAIAQAIQQIPDPMLQAEAATQLFGKSGADLLPAIKEGFIGIGNEATVMADKTVAAMDRYGDAMATAGHNIKTATGELIVWWMENEKWTNYGSILASVTASWLDAYDAITGGHGAATRATLSLTTALTGVKDPLAGLGATAHTTSGLLEHYALIQTQAEKQAEKFAAAEQKAADAAAAHLAKIKDLAASLSGTGLTQKTKDLNEAVALSALMYGRATLNSKATVEAVRALAREGAALPPLLMDIYLRHLDWAASGVKVQVGIKNLLADLPNYTQQLKNFMSVQFFDFKLPAFKTQIGNLFENLPNLAPQFKKWGEQNITEPMRRAVEETQAVLQLVGAGFDALGQHGGAAFQLVTRMAEIAVKGMIAYITATETAQKATIALSIATGIATLGIGTAVGLVATELANEAAAAKAAKKYIEDLQAAIISLGATPTTQIEWIDTAFGRLPSHAKALRMQLADLEKQAKDLQDRLDKVTGKMGELGKAVESFGGVVPAAMRPLIDDLLKSTGLTDDLKKSLEGFAKEPSWQTLEKHAKDLGIDLKAMGKSFYEAKLGDIAFGYAHDLQMFSDSGADMQLVLEGMADELGTLYSTAQKTGVKLPNTLKPYYDTLVAQGRLLDENGNKIDHLNEDTFADIEDKGLQNVVRILEEIAQLLRDGLPKAAEKGAKDVKEAFEKQKVVIPVEWADPGEPRSVWRGPVLHPAPGSGEPAGPGPELGLQGGTHGQFVDWGTGTNVTLHGREAVVPAGQGLGGAPIYITVVSQLDGREVARNQVRYIPNELRHAGI